MDRIKAVERLTLFSLHLCIKTEYNVERIVNDTMTDLH